MMRPKPEIEAPPKKSIQDEDVEQDEKKPPQGKSKEKSEEVEE